MYGVLVHVGYVPTTAYLDGVLALDDSGRIAVDEQYATDVPGAFAAGDIRGGSPRQVARPWPMARRPQGAHGNSSKPCRARIGAAEI